VSLRLRPTTAEDCRLAFDLANDPATRRASFQSRPIAWDEHVAWFTARIADTASPYFVVLAEDDSAVALARFDRRDANEALISFVLAPGWRGRGLAAPAIRLATREASAEGRFTRVWAEIKLDNERSLKAFAHAGYGDATTSERDGAPFARLSWHAATG
jgi:RimJ/RimL family protein N-acetyltransferase